MSAMEEESARPKENLEEPNEQRPSNVRSYGIDISRQKIKSVPLHAQDAALQDLGVSAYEQEEFEEGVLQQVDEAIEEQEKKLAIGYAEKNLRNIQDEIRTIEEELQKVDKTISACSGDASENYNVKKSLESLRSHKDMKLRQVQRLQAREKYAQRDLDNLLAKLKALKDTASHDAPKNSILDTEKFGIVDFKSSEQSFVDDENRPSTSKVGLEESLLLEASEDLQTLAAFDKYDKIKARKRKFDIRDEFSDSYSSADEYIPYPDEVSDELTEEEFEVGSKQSKVSFTHQDKKKKTLGIHHKKFKAGLKSKKVKKAKKVVDDGDIRLYQERIREFKLKERLKETNQLDLVADSDISEDEANDKKMISLKGGFSLSVKMWRKLFKYQRTGVKWLWELHNQEVGGILGDEMGLGKTIQIIAFLTGLKSMTDQRHRLGPVIIACPVTVLHQWVREFHKWSPEFRVAVLHDTGSFSGKKEALIKHMVNDRGVIVTSYSNLRIHQDELLRYKWDYLILDEGHKIRNPDAEITLACKQFATPHRLILSGSPLQNNLKELWSLFDFTYPGKLGTLPIFMAEFSVPITLGGYANATDVQVQTAYKCACILRDTISPYLLRRMKKDVNTSINLPTKNEQVLFCRLTQEQRDMYKRYINSRDVTSILAGKMKVFPGLIMLRKICNHPDLSSAAGSLDWMKAAKQASESGTSMDSIEFDNGYGYWRRSGKMIVVESLLRLWKEQGHRVLLFSQTRQMLDILESFVKNCSYSYVRMDGSTSIGSRQPVVERFNKDQRTFIFLLTTRVGGLGVNLIGADRVIIFDPDWNPSTDTQARERSWRIGQDKHVTIYRLLTTGTIEEKIYHRQIFKQFLTNRVLKNPAQRRFFKSNDLYELFTLGDEGPSNNTETSAIFAGTGSEIRLRAKKPKKKVHLSSSGSKETRTKARLSSSCSKEIATKLREEDSSIVCSRKSTKTEPCSSSAGRKATLGRACEGATIAEAKNSDETSLNIYKEELEISDNGSVTEHSRESPKAEIITSSAGRKSVLDRTRAEDNVAGISTSSSLDEKSERNAEACEVEQNTEDGTMVTENAKKRKIVGFGASKLLPTKKNVWAIGTEDLKIQGSEQQTVATESVNDSDNNTRRKRTQSDTSHQAKAALVKRQVSSKDEKVEKRNRIRDLKKKRRKRKHVNAEIEGTEISYLDKQTLFKHEEKADKNEAQRHKEQDEDILQALFEKSGVHSALAHDKIEASGNPDYVLVEKEAQRVAKQASEALRKSRALCRSAPVGVPTWTGSHGSAGITTQGKKPRFGSKRKTGTEDSTQASVAKRTVFDGTDMLEKKSQDPNEISSANLLQKMRARKALSGQAVDSNLDLNQYSIHGNVYGSAELDLMKEIRHFVALRAKMAGQATTQEILIEFKSKIEDRKNALFKEMLKEVCELRKVNGEGVWFLKDSFR